MTTAPDGSVVTVRNPPARSPTRTSKPSERYTAQATARRASGREVVTPEVVTPEVVVVAASLPAWGFVLLDEPSPLQPKSATASAASPPTQRLRSADAPMARTQRLSDRDHKPEREHSKTIARARARAASLAHPSVRQCHPGSAA